MIPKTIHYCWFGGEKPSDVREYILGWKKACPEYEIIEWNDKNFDVSQYVYSRDAYKEKKWAFVSDFVRFVVLEQQGGIYLDTDVEVLKNFDSLLNEHAFVGYEVIGVAAGIIGCEAHNPVISAISRRYRESSFYLEDGTLNLLTSPDFINQEIEMRGFERVDRLQILDEITVYPSDWFYPYNLKTFEILLTENTITIHHYSGSWLDEKTKLQLKIQEKLKRFPSRRLAIWLSVAFAELKINGAFGLIRAIKRK